MSESLSPEAVAKQRRTGMTLLIAVGLIAMLAVSFAIRGYLLRQNSVNRDFISYWSTGKMLAAHHNPYDRAAIFALERSQGATYQRPYIMRNPPWALILSWPLAAFSAPTAALVWMIAIIVAALGCIQLLRPPGLKTLPLTLIFFAPSLICVGAEQTSIFVLLGLALFMRLLERRPFLAGLALTLATLKPHLLLIFWPVLLLEVARRRQWSVLAGMAVGVGAGMAAALWFDPHVWSHYFAAMGAENMAGGYYPNLPSILALLVAPHSLWPEAIPTVAGLAFAGWYWARQRKQWDWRWHGAMVLAISVVTAPYSWPFDQVLYLPAMFVSLKRVPKRAVMVLAAANIVALAIYAKSPVLGDVRYWWMAPAWMVWCVYAYTRPETGTREEKAPAAAKTSMVSR